MEDQSEHSLVLAQGSVAQIIIDNCRANLISASISIHIPWLNLTRLKVQSLGHSSSVDRYLFNIPTLPPHFVARPELVARIKKELLQTPKVVCWGMRGVGKTFLSLDFFLQSLDDYQHVFRFCDVRPDTLRKTYTDLAKNMVLIKQDDDRTDAVRLLKGWMAEQKSCLLIFDDIHDFSVLADFLPPQNVHVVITSLHQFVGLSNIHVDVFTAEEASVLSTDERMCRTVGFLPKAIAHGAESVYGFWRKDMDEVKKHSPNSMVILEKLSKESGLRVDRKAFREGLARSDARFDGVVFNEALNFLTKYSLVFSDTNLIFMHMLFKTFLCEQGGHELEDRKHSI